jgi:hypothetical protein
MDESQIADVWTTLKEYFDKKHVEMAAERYVDLMADYGVSDETLKECFGHCSYLDAAIKYYLDIDAGDSDDDYNEDWDE